MKLWQDDLLIQMTGIETEAELFKVVVEEARRMGFDYCAYGLRFPYPLASPRTLSFRNHAPQWQSQYDQSLYQRIDPVVQHGMRSSEPLVWGDNVVANKVLGEFWAGARAYGLRYGWAQSSVNPTGSLGILTLARSGEVITPQELSANGMRLSWLLQATHWSMSRLLLTKGTQPEGAVTLSGRERSILQWTAEGKTSGEISDIMGIAERTVNFHITNVMTKLNCANKTAATVRAALLGLLV